MFPQGSHGEGWVAARLVVAVSELQLATVTARDGHPPRVPAGTRPFEFTPVVASPTQKIGETCWHTLKTPKSALKRDQPEIRSSDITGGRQR